MGLGSSFQGLDYADIESLLRVYLEPGASVAGSTWPTSAIPAAATSHPGHF